MSLHKEFKLVNLDLHYDTLTVYLNFKYLESVKIREAKDGAIEVMVQDGSEIENLQLNELQEAVKKIETIKLVTDSDSKGSAQSQSVELNEEKNPMRRLVHDKMLDGSEVDHGMYHNKPSEKQKNHVHFKFQNMISEAHLKKILIMFIIHKMLTSSEANQYDYCYKARKLKIETDLADVLPKGVGVKGQVNPSPDKYAHKDAIIQFIDQITHLDQLEHLHKHLLSEKFNYLRQLTGTCPWSFWQGTNANGETVTTSKTWSAIEKAIQLKMSMIVAQRCSYNTALGQKRAEQFTRNHPFFSIKRNRLSRSRTTSSSFDAFRDGDRATLDAAYQSHFRMVK